MGTCKGCGKDLVKPVRGRPPSKYCSRLCKEASYAAAKHAEVLRKRAEQRCVRCGEPIPADAGYRALTCSKSCGEAWRNEKRQAARREAWRATSPVCQCCGDAIPDSRQCGSKYCSIACKRRVLAARWRERSPGYMRQYVYGLTPERYAILLSEQGGRCAICGSASWSGGRRAGSPHVDHDHVSGAVRGLLCGNCNNGLGMFGDDPARLRAAADYLERVL